MKNKEQFLEKTCDMCKISSSTSEEDILLFGEWMHRGNLSVHYFCILLSTNLLQQGSDNSGILGFYLRDIRKEIELAAKRSCIYCNKKHASIQCHTCLKYFHLECGKKQGCLFQFCDDFRSYCDECFPLDDHQRQTLAEPPDVSLCAICQRTLNLYKPHNWIHANCCGKGWTHRQCIQKYALSAGYYLRCIWCKDAKFRDMVRKLGIFVPDRDASWEADKNNYRDFYRGHCRCDIDECICPKGRDYTAPKNTGIWSILKCSTCGSFGAHINCLKAKINQIPKEFNCDACKLVEQTNKSHQEQANNSGAADEDDNDAINKSFFIQKTTNKIIRETQSTDSPSFSKSNSSSQLLFQDESQTPVVIANGQSENIIESSNETEAMKLSNEPTQIATNSDEKNKRFHIFKLWKLVDGNCVGLYTLCVDRFDERFIGLSTEQIEESNLLDFDKDVIATSSERGIFDIIDKILETGDDQ